MLRLRVSGIVILALAPTIASAQANGTVKGILSDPNGGSAPNATVALVSKATDQRMETKTTASGAYAFTFLPPGVYEFSAELTGFKRIARNVTVDVAAIVTIDATFELGETSTEVQVVSEVPQVDTASSAVGIVVEQKLVTALPLSNRNFTQILALSPGVNASVANAGSLGRNSVNISANGSRPYDNSIVLNGLVAENPMSQGFDDDVDKGGVPVPSPDALQEFKVQTALYDAETGRQGGAVIEAVTKSGTNQFHGTLFEFFRNDDLNANSFFNNKTGQPRGVLKQNQFGGTIGGPIKKDKLFFFFSYQGTKQVNATSSFSTASTFLPPLTNDRSAAALGKVFGGQSGIRGGVAVAPDGSNINPVALAFLNAKLPNGQYVIPSPQTILSNGSGFSTYSLPAYFTEQQYIGDFDYQVNNKNRIAGKIFFSHDPWTIPFSTSAGDNVPGFGENDDKANWNDTLILTTTITPTIVNEVRGGYVRNFIRQIPIEPVSDAQVGITPPVAGYTGIPLISITGGFTIGPATNNNQVTMIHQELASDTLSIVKGRHQIRVGGDLNIVQVNRTNAFLTRGSLGFGSFADFLLGLTAAQNHSGFSNVNSSQVANGVIRAYPRFKNYSLFVEDDFRVNSRLTLNLGLRYQFNGDKTDKRGRIGGFDTNLITPFQAPPAGGTYAGFTVVNNCGCTPPAGFVKVGSDSPIYDQNYLGFAPRVGLAYRPIASDENLVFRMGYGIFWSSVAGTVTEQSNFDPYYVWNKAGGADLLSTSWQNPFPVPVPPTSAFPVYLPYTLGSTRSTLPTDPYLRQPYTQQWSANVQYSMKDYLFQVGYVGSASTHLIAGMYPNQPLLASLSNPVDGLTVNTVANRALRSPYLGWLPTGIDEFKSVLTGHYDALQLSVNHRFANGLSFIGAYTWSHALDDDGVTAGGRNEPLGSFVGDYYNTKSAWGNASFDRTHRLVVSYSYTTPKLSLSSRLLAAVGSNWILSGVTTVQSGLPFSVTDSTSGTIYGISAYAQYAPGITLNNVVLSGSTQSRLNQYFNTAAYTTAPVIGDGTGFGDSGRDVLRGPGQVNFDTSFGREFTVGGLSEGAQLQFRSEFFNIFNHAQFNNPGSNLGAPSSFGVISSTAVGPRIVQFGMKYSF
ncbi:MAG TPA: carboxypeptidase-like regulatory domain-containing protein [Bryobacteraceae bacterium]|nr:carboxypeptidase-like regulatory domain-containing protein [Bryobacteraceae bacterium]